jgi:hypothetical protein
MYLVTCEDKDQDLQTAQEIYIYIYIYIIKKNYHHQQITHPKQKHNLSTNNSEVTQKSKWATFTYHGPDTRKVAKLSKNTNIKIALKTTNTIYLDAS